MRSVTNIQKITMAMKMVAASKMRVAQAATEQSRGLVEPFLRLLGDLPGELVWEWKSREGLERACWWWWGGVC
jgi:F0F1-type ATP synthase gamma subunit